MKRVLIVMGDATAAAETEQAMHSAGHWPVSRARCFQSAMAAIDGNHVDLAIVDTQLTDGSDGAEVARVLKMHYDVDVIMISDDARANKTVMDIEHRFVQKPVEVEILVNLAGPASEAA